MGGGLDYYETTVCSRDNNLGRLLGYSFRIEPLFTRVGLIDIREYVLLIMMDRSLHIWYSCLTVAARRQPIRAVR